jgi:polyhydroxyalkanoate synthesis repressor PhaR
LKLREKRRRRNGSFWAGASVAADQRRRNRAGRTRHKEGVSPSMSEARVIKKYPNRRLYDTEESRYITLSDIRRLVLEKVDFVVIDKKSQADITSSILLQVISEQEQSGEPIMSRDFLSQIIRSYGGTMQGMVSSYLEQSMKLFLTQQQQVRDRVKSVVGIDPVGIVADLTTKNYQRWRAVQEEIFRTLTGGGRTDEDKREAKKKETATEERQG